MIKKSYSKTGRSCRVTFKTQKQLDAQTVSLCGEFNDWDAEAHPLQRRKDGSFSTTISLEPGRQYRFRYLLDGERWANDAAADDYAPNTFGTEDSIVAV